MKKIGFTLIELLVVIAIVGILLALGTASYITAMKQSRDTKRKTDLEQIRQALETYRSENGTYPILEGWTTTLLSGYISEIPVDPKTSEVYYYSPGTLQVTYSLCATLEVIPIVPVIGCNPAIYNYELNNP